jgi:hypothetical protein
MKLQFTILGLCALGLYATAGSHTWILKNGDKIEGEYVGTTSKKVFIMNNGATTTVKISDLSTNDLAYIVETQLARRQARLDREAKRLTQSGAHELTRKLFDSLTDKAEGQPCWLDGKFAGLHQLWINSPGEIGFSMEDKNADLLTNCIVARDVEVGGSSWAGKKSEARPSTAGISDLQRGDRVRLVGKIVMSKARSPQRFFRVDRVEVIERAAKQAPGDEGETDSSPGGLDGKKLPP